MGDNTIIVATAEETATASTVDSIIRDDIDGYAKQPMVITEANDADTVKLDPAVLDHNDLGYFDTEDVDDTLLSAMNVTEDTVSIVVDEETENDKNLSGGVESETDESAQVELITPVKTTVRRKKTKHNNGPAKTYATRGSRSNGKSLTVIATPLKKRIAVCPRVKKNVDEQTYELAYMKSNIVALQNAVKSMELTIKNQQIEIANLQQDQERDKECHGCLNVRKELVAARAELINFYTDNDKTCSRNGTLLRKDLLGKIEEVSKVASDTSKLVYELKHSTSPASVPTTCPQSTTIGHNNLQIDSLWDEVNSIKENINDLTLTGSSVVENKKKTKKSGVDKALSGQNESSRSKTSNSNKFQFGEFGSSQNASQTPPPNKSTHKRKSLNNNKKNIILFMDSNRNFLNPDLLWENLTIVPAGNISELTTQLENNDLRDYDIVMIHVGVNDLDKSDGKTTAKRLIGLTSRIKSSVPGIKIILSQITPRQLHRDDEVLVCNEELNILNNAENITIAKHSNLRDKEWSFHKPNDDKHFTRSAIARLAGNLKSAFRKALGIKPRRLTNNQGRDNRGLKDKQYILKKIMNLLR